MLHCKTWLKARAATKAFVPFPSRLDSMVLLKDRPATLARLVYHISVVFGKSAYNAIVNVFGICSCKTRKVVLGYLRIVWWCFVGLLFWNTPREMAHIIKWRVFVGQTATGKTRYANFLEAQGGQPQQAQQHGVQIIDELGPMHVNHMANILENVRLDVQEVVLLTNFPCVVQAAVNIAKNTYDVDPDVWLFARHDDVDVWMQRLEGSVQKVMIPEDERNHNGSWQEILCDDLING